MFEQATLPNGPAGKRAWTTLLGFSSQMALVSLAILMPMMWPQVLPLTKLEMTLAPPLPPGPQKLGDKPAQRQPGHTTVVRRLAPSQLTFQPTHVPDHIAHIVDEAPEMAVIGSLGPGIGAKDGVVGSILSDILATTRVIPRPHIEEAPAKAAPAVAPEPAIRRVRAGGVVLPGKVLHRVEPQYPALARSARASGVVELECVVGTDGRIIEVKVKSGNPLLVRAAVDAAWQWLYEPTKLNGNPVEIITMMTFTFKLN